MVWSDSTRNAGNIFVINNEYFRQGCVVLTICLSGFLNESGPQRAGIRLGSGCLELHTNNPHTVLGPCSMPLPRMFGRGTFGSSGNQKGLTKKRGCLDEPSSPAWQANALAAEAREELEENGDLRSGSLLIGSMRGLSRVR